VLRERIEPKIIDAARIREGEHSGEVHRRRQELLDVAVDEAAVADGLPVHADGAEAVAARARGRRDAAVGEEVRARHHLEQRRPALLGHQLIGRRRLHAGEQWDPRKERI